MRIDHIAIWTDDIEILKEFYHKYFKASYNDKYINKKTLFESYFLTFNGGTRLEVMQKPDLTGFLNNDNTELYGYSHIAFSVGSVESVLELTEIIRNDGYKVFKEPRWTGDGYFESTILDPDGNRIEITA